MKRLPVLIVLTLAVAACLAAAQQSQQQQGAVTWMELPLKFPVVGNIEAVRQWRFGRIQEVQDTAGTDLNIRIRVDNGNVVNVVGPGPELADLAWQSDWVRNRSRQFPGRQDWAERMIAFDVDGTGRLIAMASLEPINRDRNRLRQALGI